MHDLRKATLRVAASYWGSPSYKGYKTRERYQEMTHGEEGDRETWQERKQRERAEEESARLWAVSPEAKRQKALASFTRSFTYQRYQVVADWLRKFGDAKDQALAKWFLDTVINVKNSLANSSLEEIEENRTKYDTVEGVYADKLGRQFLDRVQDLLKLPTPTTVPPYMTESTISESVLESNVELTQILKRATKFRSSFNQETLQQWVETKLENAFDNLPDEVTRYIETRRSPITVGGQFDAPRNLSMSVSDVGYYPDFIPKNLYVPVGTLYNFQVILGGPGFNLARSRHRIYFATFEYLEASPKVKFFGLLPENENLGLGSPVPSGQEMRLPGGSGSGIAITPQEYRSGKPFSVANLAIKELIQTLPDIFREKAKGLEERQKQREDQFKEEARIKAEKAEEARLRAEKAQAQAREEAAKAEAAKAEAAKAREEARRQREAPKTVVDSAVEVKLNILDRLIGKGFAPAVAIAQKVKDTYLAGKKPTDDDLKALRNMMYRSGMKPEADNFRVATYAKMADKYDGIDFTPPDSVANAAEKGLKYRQKASPSNRGGLTTEEAGKQGIGSGVQRAVNLKNKNKVTPETINKMVAFFARHEKNKGIAPEHKSEPWNDKGHVAWLLWGGDPGKAWAEKVKGQMERADAKKAAYSGNPDGKPIYPNKIDHGEKEPLAGGTDVVRRLQDKLLHEQGNEAMRRPGGTRLASDKDYQDFVTYMDANAVRFPKKQAWWLPAHNMAVNMTLVGTVNLWRFTVLPFQANKRAYVPETATHPAGILIHPTWNSSSRDSYAPSLKFAMQLLAVADREVSVGDTIKAEMKWIETHFHVDIPNDIVTKLVMQAPKMAIRRWGVDRLKVQSTFIPFDTGEAVALSQSQAWDFARTARSVAAKYLARK